MVESDGSYNGILNGTSIVYITSMQFRKKEAINTES